ncbi:MULTISPECIES: transfer repressor [Enterobacteriaceae]|uniref:transfer repressor n=1 Tax=Enterobacteriaceae TaxID=543 RepID=UPI000981315E|nr:MULTISPECIES: transfer repressor [Enterobacteriaceae]MCE9985292.1 transfer repressor [Leclercia adecarboxylata]MDU1983708.1 transfer repressor [Streptococcus parasanguinis]OOB84402.1 transfer repressor [Leclercia adecarboxylata]VAE23315.1 Uncharacterised protein [Enterobacter hormaechei]
MFPNSEMIHGLRRAELINLLDNSRMPVKHAFNPFRKPDSRVIEPVLFDIDELHVRVTPVSVVRHNWAIAPVDTIVIEVTIPPVDDNALMDEDVFLRDSGIGHIQQVPAGVVIRRTVTFVGGIMPQNLLYQMEMLCVSALHLLGEEIDESD